MAKGRTKNSEMLLARHSSTGNQPVWRIYHKNKEQSQNDLVHRLFKRFALIELKIKDIQANTHQYICQWSITTNCLTRYELSLQVLTSLSKLNTFENNNTILWKHLSSCLWRSMIHMLILRRSFDYNKNYGAPSFQNIQSLDFADMISQLNDYTEQIHSARCRIRDDLIESHKR